MPTISLPRLAHRPALIAPLLFLATLYPLSAQAISSRTLFAPVGEAELDEFGSSVATAGDVNGDGYADVIVGAPNADAGGDMAGRAYVYYGGPHADAVADLTLTGATANDYLGCAVGTAGDMNRDGYDDVIVGAFNSNAGGAATGQAYVYFGGASPDAVADLTLNGVAVSDNFGISVATAGDVNGDGYDDVIVGAEYNDTGGPNAGQAYVYYGAASPDAMADLTLTGTTDYGFFGCSVGTAGDVNGDGYDDVIVGAWQAGSGGRAFVYYGGASPDATPDWLFAGAAAGDSFGCSVGTAGDVNGDGYADMIVGAQEGEASAGAAYVYFGGRFPDEDSDLTFIGEATYDLFGCSVGTAGDMNGDRYDDVIVGAEHYDGSNAECGRAYVFFGGPGVDAVADLTLTGAMAGDNLGNAVGTAGDVNADGLAEVIVGARCGDVGGPYAGQAYVTALYPYEVLSPNGGEQWVAGETATVRWQGYELADIAFSTDGGVTYSTLVSNVGGADENELAVTAPGIATAFGKIRVSQSGLPVQRSTSDASDGVFRIVLPVVAPAAASQLVLAPTGAAEGDVLGSSVGTAGDVNGDGYADVIVGAPYNDDAGSNAGAAYVYYGGPGADETADLTLTGAAGDRFGWSVASAGDMNGDGYADVIVGAPYNSDGGSSAGAAYVYHGGASPDVTADLTLTGEATNNYFGAAVATAGDVNGDGYADVIVGAPFNSAGGTNAGRVYLYHGGPGADATADLTLTGEAADDYFGMVQTAGDVNGDGYDDVIVGANYNDAGGTNAGRAYLFYGGPSADATADLTFTGSEAYDYLGQSVGTAGDVDGDGYADLIVGAPYHDAGRAYVYHGGPGADATADLTLAGVGVAEEFGRSAGTAGDVNGDGFADLIVGASDNDAGRAYVYYGGPGADAAADLTLTGAADGDEFGYSVGTAADVNGDGLADLIVGAYHNDAGGSNAGRAYVYDCNRYFVLSPNGGETWNVGALQSVSWLGAEPADLWLSVDGGRTYDLLLTGVGGEASNVMPLRVPHAPTRFARIKMAPHEPGIGGCDMSDSLFTIQSSVSLLLLVANLAPEGGTTLTWSSDPGVGPEGLAGYRLYRLARGEDGNGTRISDELIVTTSYHDADGAAGHTYRLAAVNNLAEELELGRVTVAGPVTGLHAWPSPLPARGELQIQCAMPPATDLDMGLFDIAGRRVATLASSGGPVSLSWHPPASVGAGVYFLRASAPSVKLKLEMRVVLVP